MRLVTVKGPALDTSNGDIVTVKGPTLDTSLEGNVPKLVYEFTPKGNLYDRHHGDNRIPMSFDVRLK